MPVHLCFEAVRRWRGDVTMLAMYTLPDIAAHTRKICTGDIGSVMLRCDFTSAYAKLTTCMTQKMYFERWKPNDMF